MNQYEAMFLFDPTFGNSFENCETEIGRLMERANAEIILCRKWDERRLAYRIKGRKRGVYVLTYFKAPPEKIVPLERDAKLSADILRLLVLRADDMTREAMEHAVTSWREESGRSDEFERRGHSGPEGSTDRRGPPARPPAPKAEPAAQPADVGSEPPKPE